MGRKKGQTVTEFMVGRYGYDKFSQFLIILAMILMVLTVLLKFRYLYIVAILVLIFGYYRIASKNIKRRKRELELYTAIASKFSFKKKQQDPAFVAGGVKRYADFEVTQELGDDEETVYYCYKCRSCGEEVREPEGKGVIKVVCPGCGKEFVDRT